MSRSTPSTAPRKALRIVWDDDLVWGIDDQTRIERLEDALYEVGGFIHGQGYNSEWLVSEGRTEYEVLYDNIVAALRGERTWPR